MEANGTHGRRCACSARNLPRDPVPDGGPGVVWGAQPGRGRFRLPRPAEWRAWGCWCAALFPLSKPVYAALDLPDDIGAIGQCWDDGDRYLIVVDRKLDYVHALETLMHEWAHLLRLEEAPDCFDAHDDGFFTTFGRIYRAKYHPEDGP